MSSNNSEAVWMEHQTTVTFVSNLRKNNSCCWVGLDSFQESFVSNVLMFCPIRGCSSCHNQPHYGNITINSVHWPKGISIGLSLLPFWNIRDKSPAKMWQLWRKKLSITRSTKAAVSATQNMQTQQGTCLRRDTSKVSLNAATIVQTFFQSWNGSAYCPIPMEANLSMITRLALLGFLTMNQSELSIYKKCKVTIN